MPMLLKYAAINNRARMNKCMKKPETKASLVFCYIYLVNFNGIIARIQFF